VATSAGEVGIDLDADHLVCDLVVWERMVQRFGRVNRRGGDKRLASIVVIDEGPEPKNQEALTTDEQTRIRIYQGVKQLFEQLRDDSNATISVSPEALRQLNERASNDDTLRQSIFDASSAAPLRPALNRALVDAWSMTSLLEHTGRPDIAPWLRGWVDELPQTTVVWRKYLPVRTKPQVTKKEIEDFFEAAPIHTSETLETETFRVMKWLQTRAGKLDEHVRDRVCGILLTVDGNYVQVLNVKDLLGDSKTDKKRHKDIEMGLRGKTLIMSAVFGGLKKDGLLSHDEKNGWLSPDKDKVQLPETADGDALWMDANAETPVIRFRIIERDTEPDEGRDDAWLESLRFELERNNDGEITRWLSIQKCFDASNTENDRAEGWPQALAEHQYWAAECAEAIGKRLGLPDDYIAMLAIAARLHDEGKRAKRWQRAFNAERDKKKCGISGDLAKTRGPINQAVLDGYRHEFGSLPYAKDDDEFKKLSEELQDLALHLIAAHHGYARPLIATDGCEDAPPSMLEERAREVALRFARLQKRWGPWGLAWWETLLRTADVQASRDNDKREKN
jgi:CRISPR-associated endonuclease/helicase Cas3